MSTREYITSCHRSFTFQVRLRLDHFGLVGLWSYPVLGLRTSAGYVPQRVTYLSGLRTSAGYVPQRATPRLIDLAVAAK
jgi:hypothetical protein